MKSKIKKVIIFVLVFYIITELMGCFELVDSVKKFPIEEFNVIPGEKEEEYILSGKLDFAEIENLFIIPRMAERYDPLCELEIDVYSQENIEGLSIDKLSLIDESGKIIFEEKNLDDWNFCDCEYCSTDVLFHWFIYVYPEVTEDWWYGGNNLVLNITASVQKGEEVIMKEMSYHIHIEQYRTSKWDL